MPPLQACMPQGPPTSSSTRVDGTSEILTHFSNMSIQENVDAEKAACQNSAVDGKGPEVDGDDVVALTSAVRSISLGSASAEEGDDCSISTEDTKIETVSNLNIVVQEGDISVSTEDTKTETVSSLNIVVQEGDISVSTKDTKTITVSSEKNFLLESLSEVRAVTESDDDDCNGDCQHIEGSEYDSSSDEYDDVEAEDSKRRTLKCRGPERTRVYSIDRQAGGCVYTYPSRHNNNNNRLLSHNTLDSSLALPAQQWWMDYRDPQVNNELCNELNNVDSSSNDNINPDPEVALLFQEVCNHFNFLPEDDVNKFFEELDNGSRVVRQPVETDDEGVWEPSSPESISQNYSPAHYDTSSFTTSSGVGSPSGSSVLSLPPSPAQVQMSGISSPYHHVPIWPKARPARDAILDSISQDEKDEAFLKINSASEEKLMRAHDPDGDTNLTVLVQFWEKHNRPMALLYAMVERMKFIKNGLSKKTVKGENALHLAAMFAHADPLVARYIAEVMVECGDDVNEVDVNGNTVIHYLCCKGDSHINVLDELLIVKKFDVNHTNNDGVTPLKVACSKGAVQMVALLLASGAQLDQPRNGASSRGEPLVLLPPDQLQEVERLYKMWARRKQSR